MMSLPARAELLEHFVRNHSLLPFELVKIEAAALCWEEQIRLAAWPFKIFDLFLSLLSGILGTQKSLQILIHTPILRGPLRGWLHSLAGMSV